MESWKGQKYCTNPLNLHGSKMKDLRLVTVDQAKKHPSLVSLGQKICSKCQKEIAKLPAESNQDYLGDLSDDIATPPRRPSQSSGNKDVISSEDTFSCPESDLETINKSLGLIGVSPLKKHKTLTTASYLPKRSKKFMKQFLRNLRVCVGQHLCKPRAM